MQGHAAFKSYVGLFVFAVLWIHILLSRITYGQPTNLGTSHIFLASSLNYSDLRDFDDHMQDVQTPQEMKVYLMLQGHSFRRSPLAQWYGGKHLCMASGNHEGTC